MREGGGRIVLMDFGAGQPFSTADQPVEKIVGTPLYLAPELFKGEQPSRASDIYALGVLFITWSPVVIRLRRKALGKSPLRIRVNQDACCVMPVPIWRPLSLMLSNVPYLFGRPMVCDGGCFR